MGVVISPISVVVQTTIVKMNNIIKKIARVEAKRGPMGCSVFEFRPSPFFLFIFRWISKFRLANEEVELPISAHFTSCKYYANSRGMYTLLPLSSPCLTDLYTVLYQSKKRKNKNIYLFSFYVYTIAFLVFFRPRVGHGTVSRLILVPNSTVSFS